MPPRSTQPCVLSDSPAPGGPACAAGAAIRHAPRALRLGRGRPQAARASRRARRDCPSVPKALTLPPSLGLLPIRQRRERPGVRSPCIQTLPVPSTSGAPSRRRPSDLNLPCDAAPASAVRARGLHCGLLLRSRLRACAGLTPPACAPTAGCRVRPRDLSCCQPSISPPTPCLVRTASLCSHPDVHIPVPPHAEALPGCTNPPIT